MFKKILLLLLALDLLILNTIIGYFTYQTFQKNNFQKTQGSNEDFQKTDLKNIAFECDKDCQNFIDDRISKSLASQENTTTPAPLPSLAQTQTQIKTTRVSYVPISGSGSTLETSWTDLPATSFYFDKADFVGFVGATFEANVKLVNGNGEAYVRLFDVTNGVGVSGSEVKTNSQTSVSLTSGNLQFYTGRNLYRIQARSLTADTTNFESGRIKVVYQE